MNLYESCLVQLLAVVVLQLAAGLHPTPHPKIYTFQKVAEFPHDHMAFTQGAQATYMPNPSAAHQHLGDRCKERFLAVTTHLPCCQKHLVTKALCLLALRRSGVRPCVRRCSQAVPGCVLGVHRCGDQQSSLLLAMVSSTRR